MKNALLLVRAVLVIFLIGAMVCSIAFAILYGTATYIIPVIEAQVFNIPVDIVEYSNANKLGRQIGKAVFFWLCMGFVLIVGFGVSYNLGWVEFEDKKE